MAECTSCGGFVTDDYVRVFGNNENEIEACRGCRAERGSDEEETDEENVVLLRDIKGTDADQVGRRAGTDADDGTEPEPAERVAVEAETADSPDTSPESPSRLDSIKSTLRSLSR